MQKNFQNIKKLKKKMENKRRKTHTELECVKIGYANGISGGKNYGLTGAAKGSEVFNIAVGAYSESGNTTNGTNYGVSARASSVTATGTNYGIYSAASNGAVNYAGFFNGDVTITGTLVQPSDRKLKKEVKRFQHF